MNIFKKLFGAKTDAKSFVSQSVNGLVSFARRFRVRSSAVDPYGAIAGWVFFALDKIAMSFSGAELQLFKLKPNGDVEEVKAHPILDLFEKPNPVMSGREMRYLLSMHMGVWGIAHLYKFRGANKNIVELWPVRPDLLIVESSVNGFPAKYKYRVGLEEMMINASDLITIKRPSAENPMQGQSALQAISHEVDADMAAAVWQKYFIENGAEPGGVLETEQELTDEQFANLQDSWGQRHAGPTNAGKISVLEKGLKYKSVSTSPKELDYIASRNMSRDTILTIMGVPKGLVISDNVNRANADAAQHVFASSTIEPLVKMFCEAASNNLIPEFDSSLWLWFRPVTQQDQEQLRLDSTAGVDKWFTRNEIRAQYGLDPVEGGDILYAQMGNIPLDQVKAIKLTAVFRNNRHEEIKSMIIRRNGRYERGIKSSVEKVLSRVVGIKGFKIVEVKKEEEVKKDEWAGIHTKVKEDRLLFLKKTFPKRAKEIKKALRKVFNDQEKAISAALEKYAPVKAAGKSWVNDMLADNELDAEGLSSTIKDAYAVNIVDGASAVSGLMGEASSITGPTSQNVLKFLKSAPNDFAVQVNETTMQSLRDSLTEGAGAQESMSDLMGRVADVFDEARSYRSEMIARTEIGKAQNFGRFEEMTALNVGKKMWVATGSNSRAWHMEANGQVVGAEEAFDVDGESLMYPQEPGSSAENCINCQCTVSPASEYFTGN